MNPGVVYQAIGQMISALETIRAEFAPEVPKVDPEIAAKIAQLQAREARILAKQAQEVEEARLAARRAVFESQPQTEKEQQEINLG